MSFASLDRRQVLKMAGAFGLTLAAAPLLASCTSAPKSAGSTGSAAPGGIRIWSWFAPIEPYLKTAAAAFEKETGTKVQVQTWSFPNYQPALQAAFQADDEGDIFAPGTLAIQLAAAGRVVDLSKAFDKTFIDGFYPATTAMGQYKGGQYSLPFGAQMFGMFYNKPFFESNNFTLPETWDDMIALAPEIRAKGMNPVSLFGNDGSALADFWLPLVTQLTDDPQFILDLDSHQGKTTWDCDQVIGALTKLKQLIDAGVFDPGVLAVDQDAAYASYYSGRSAMLFSQSGALNPLKKAAPPDFIAHNLAVTKVPAWKSGARHWTANQGGQSWQVSTKSPNQKAAIKFLQYIYEPDAYAAAMNSGGYIPSIKAAVPKVTDPISQTMAKWLDTGDGAPHILFGAGSFTAVGQGVSAVFNRSSTPQEAAKLIEAQVLQARSLQ